MSGRVALTVGEGVHLVDRAVGEEVVSLRAQLARVEGERDEAMRSNKILRRTLERLHQATSEQQYTINSRGWNVEPSAPDRNDLKWSVAGARYHQYREVEDANTDAADVLNREGKEHELIPSLIQRAEKAEGERDEARAREAGLAEALKWYAEPIADYLRSLGLRVE